MDSELESKIEFIEIGDTIFDKIMFNENGDLEVIARIPELDQQKIKRN